MRTRYKISIVILLLLTAVFFLVKFQARRIVTTLIESNADGQIHVDIGSLNIRPYSGSLRLKSLNVLVRDAHSPSYKKIRINDVFIDVASLWDFFSGGTLIIEKFECTGSELAIYNSHTADSTTRGFNLDDVIQHIQSEAIRFRIRDIVFNDLNLLLTRDTLKAPLTVKHLYARAQNLYLSADSLLKEKPLVEFSLPAQQITFPNNLHLGFDSLSFTTVDNSMQILNVEVKSPPADATHAYQVQSDKVRITRFNFESLYSTGKVKIDSIFLGKSTVAIDWKIHQPENNAQKKQRPGLALPPIDIQHVVFKELASSVAIRKDTLINNFTIEHASLMVDAFTHTPDSSRVIYSPRYNLVITKYATFMGGSNASIRFDTIQIQKHSLSLLNFTYQTADQRQPLLRTPRLELENVDWYEFLINRKLVADELLVSDPTIITTIKTNPNQRARPIDSFRLVELLNAYFRVNLFSVKNATALVKLPDRNTDVMLNGYNTTIHVSDLINSATVNEGLKAIRQFSFNNLRLTNPDYVLQLGHFQFGDQGTSMEKLSYQTSTNMSFQATGLNLNKVGWNESLNQLVLDGLGWQHITMDLKSTTEKSSSPDAPGKRPNLLISDVRGGATDISFSRPDVNVTTSIHHMNLSFLNVSDSVVIKGIDLMGKSLRLGSELNDVRVGEFAFSDSGGFMHDIWLNRNTVDYVNLTVGKLSFNADLPDFLHQKFVLRELSLDQVKARYNKQDSIQYLDVDIDGQLVAHDLNFLKGNLSVGRFYFNTGPFVFSHEKLADAVPAVEESGSKSDRQRLKNVTDTLMQSSPVLKFSRPASKHFKAALSAKDSSASALRKLRVASQRGGVQLYATNIQSFIQDSSRQVRANVNKIEFSEVDFSTEKLAAWINTGSLNNLVLNTARTADAWQVIEDNHPTFGISNLQGKVEVNGNRIQVGRLDYRPQTASATIQHFEFKPLKDRRQFLDDSFYQANYMSTSIATVSMERLNIKQLLADTVFHLGAIHVESPNLEIGRDKTHPFLAKGIKPLPTNAFRQVGIRFKVDTLQLSEGQITYTEKSRITGKEGMIGFTNMNAMVRNIKNIDLHDDDSLYIRATTRFLDSAVVKLRVRESYRDTLAGFLMTTDVSPFHTSILNQALVPMVSVDFKSGFVDTLHMRAIGREYLSLGTMKFLYRDLKVEFLDKNDTSRHSIKNQLLKFAANTFVIRTNNRNRIGDVYFERDRNRAVFQYWVKMILSGVTTSVGAKSNKKQIKKYLKSLNQKKLPPIKGDFDL